MNVSELKTCAPALYALLFAVRDIGDERLVRDEAQRELDRLLRAERQAMVHECLLHATTLPSDDPERAMFAHVGEWLLRRSDQRGSP